MFLRLRLVVADVAVHRCAGPGMAARTIPIRSAMVHGEGMTADTDAAPGTGIVALRALPRPMVCWPCMAGLAVRLTLMIEGRILPATGIVAG